MHFKYDSVNYLLKNVFSYWIRLYLYIKHQFLFLLSKFILVDVK